MFRPSRRARPEFGLISDQASGFFASFTEKYIGSWVVYDTITNPDIAGGGSSRAAHSSDYWLGDRSIGYGHRLNQRFFRSFKVRFQVGNVFNQKVQVLDSIDPNIANAYTKDAFNVMPVRNYFLTVATEILRRSCRKQFG